MQILFPGNGRGLILRPYMHRFYKETRVRNDRSRTVRVRVSSCSFLMRGILPYTTPVLDLSLANLIGYIQIPLVSGVDMGWRTTSAMRCWAARQLQGICTLGYTLPPSLSLNDVSVCWSNQVWVLPPSRHLYQEQYLPTHGEGWQSGSQISWDYKGCSTGSPLLVPCIW